MKRYWIGVALALVASALGAQDKFTAANLPTCSTGNGYVYILEDGASSSDCSSGGGANEVLCQCVAGSRSQVAGGGGGSGDITDVFACTTGNCNALTAAAGDSLNMASGDSSIPAPQSTSLPGTCTEGFWYQDTDSSGTETSVCTASNTWTKLGPAITLDIGDDGGSDATNVNEIATTNDTYSMVTGSGSKITIDPSIAAPYGQYDPMNPGGCSSDGSNVCEEWTGDAEALTWSQGNAGSSSQTITHSGSLVSGDTNDQIHAWFTDPPLSGNTDMVVTAVMRIKAYGTSTGDGCGIIILHGGSVATPTDMAILYWVDSGTDSFRLQNWTGYTLASATDISGITSGQPDTAWRREILQLRYTDSTRVTTARFAPNGQDTIWIDLSSSKTLTNDPIKVGYFVRRNMTCFVEAFRVRQDANKDDAGQ